MLKDFIRHLRYILYVKLYLKVTKSRERRARRHYARHNFLVKRQKGNNEIDKQKEKKNMERSEIEREKKEKIMN